MLDIKFIRENPEVVKKALRDRNVEFDLDYLIQLDEKRRAKIKEVDDMRASQNQISDAIARLQGEEKNEKINESKEIKTKLGHAEFELKAIEEEFNSLLYKIPNIPLDDVPVGKDESENVVLREVGEKPKFDFTPRDYMEIGTRLDLIDTERAAKVSGSRFGYLKNEAVLLEFALAQFALERLRGDGFIPVVPPVLIREKMMRGMGYIDSKKDSEERYFLENDNLFLVGTSEQSIVPMHANEVLDVIPLYYVGFSSCFRREAGSYGKDTYGILRVHQFDKLEMIVFSPPEISGVEHEHLLEVAEWLIGELKIPYRVVQLCTGDLSQPSAITYDIEAWLPGQKGGEGEYRETHSISNTTNYQSRRLNIRIPYGAGKFEFVHILNGTALAIGRMLIAILENYQQENGSVAIPDVLQPYMAGIKIIKRA
ncbi:MAG: seryl-tRNA synthetase [Parcubacteria group bacterium Gr01-1014_33]|nr:MAG: seryl-tRNA synthetase [Parcubacteria group bacterium Gr01-1014_33]